MSRDILLSLIDPDPGQPRKHFDPAGLNELAQSMSVNGLAVPILVRPADNRFTIVHGERRYRAAMSLGWETIPADVRKITEEEARRLSLIENVQRADLSPIEEAEAYRAYLDQGMTQTKLGEWLGKSQSYIATKLRFLKLTEEVKNELAGGRITEGHAKQLLRLIDVTFDDSVWWPTERYTIEALCRRIVKEGWTVNQTKQKIDAVILLAFNSPAKLAALGKFLKEGEKLGYDVAGFLSEEYLYASFYLGDLLNTVKRWVEEEHMDAFAYGVLERTLGEINVLLKWERETNEIDTWSVSDSLVLGLTPKKVFYSHLKELVKLANREKWEIDQWDLLGFSLGYWRDHLDDLSEREQSVITSVMDRRGCHVTYSTVEAI